MGCDIHFFVERYTTEPDTSNGPKDVSAYREERINSIIAGDDVKPRWVSVDKWKNIKDGDYSYWDCDHFYDNRNYWLFYFLADVRSGPKQPIDDPRGVPEDASDSYKYIVNDWKGDGHSHSYFTLSELLSFPDSTWDELECPDFRETIEKMKLVDSNPDNGRCVFFFDN